MNTNFWYLLPVVIYLSTIVFIFVLVIFSNPMRKKIKEFDGQMNRQGEGIFSIDAKPVIIKYFPGFRGRSPEFRISTPGTFGAKLVVRTETSQDKFYKKIGLNSEVQIPDKELDDKFYFECDIPEFLNQLFLNSDVKPLVLDILTNFSSIEITKNICTFKQYPSGALENISKESITVATRKLLMFVTFIPRAVGNPHLELASFRIWRFILYFGSNIVLIGGIVFWAWASISFRIVDTFRFWYLSAGWAFACVSIGAYLAFLRIKGFSTSARVFIHFLISFGIGTLLLVRFGGAAFNGIFDKSSVKKFEQVVINKYMTTHKSSTTYHVVVEPWHSGKSGWEFTVGQGEYAHIKPGSTHCQILTKSGRLGFELVISERLIGDEAVIFSKSWPSRDYSQWYPLPSNVGGMDAEEFIYWQKWCGIIENGITNRWNVHEGLNARHENDEYIAIENEYHRRQEKVITQFSDLQPPERLKKFQEYVVNAGNDQIHFYEDYARSKVDNKNKSFNEFLNHADLKTSDQKLWAAYHYFQSLYPSIDKATNDAIEQRLAWFDII